MAINYPGPYEIRLFYDTQLAFGRHELRLSLALEADPNVGDLFSAITAVNRSGPAGNLDAEVDQLHGLLIPLYASGTDFFGCELWKYPPQSFDASFVSAYIPAGTGTPAGSNIAASQGIISFRTTLGGIMKITMMEFNVAIGAQQSFPTANASINALASYLLGDNMPWVGRDGGFAIQSRFFFPGQNERLWKLYNRSGT